MLSSRLRTPLLILAALPALGFGADLPTPAKTAIVPATSLAGVATGDSKAEAQAALGKRCQSKLALKVCGYGKPESAAGFVAIFPDFSPISGISISTGFDGRGRTKGFRGPLLRLTTPRGDIGLGSKIAKVRKYYPRARVERFGKFERVTFQGDPETMTFGTAGSKAGKRITFITLTAPVRIDR